MSATRAQQQARAPSLWNGGMVGVPRVQLAGSLTRGATEASVAEPWSTSIISSRHTRQQDRRPFEQKHGARAQGKVEVPGLHAPP